MIFERTNMTDKTNDLKDIESQTEGYSAEKLLEYAVKRFAGKISLASSFSIEDQVLTDMLCRISPNPSIFTLDTGRLPEETYQTAQKTVAKYGIKIEFLFPNNKDVEDMVNKFGINLFYESIENRKLCCRVRKIESLKRKLSQLDAWICGLRSEQSVTRKQLKKIEYDETFSLFKICPLADWTTRQVWDYIKTHNVPYNQLYDKGFTSIGCQPCTRAIATGEDIRAGRWWWEEPEHKECGLHLKAKLK